MSSSIAIGQYALTPDQLEVAGVLKPGSADLVNNMIASGMPISKSLPRNLFTGKPGAENLEKLTKNVSAQTDALVTNFQQSQTSLTNAGVITGTEPSMQIAGAVLSTTQQGLNQTLDTIKQNATDVLGASNNTFAKASGVMKDISAGNQAASFAEKAKGGLGGIAGSADAKLKSLGLDELTSQSQGAAAAAFSAIAASMPKLEVGVPVDLVQVAKKSASATGASSLGISPTSAINTNLTGAIKGSLIDNAQGAITNNVNNLIGSGTVANALTTSISNASLISNTNIVQNFSSSTTLLNQTGSAVSGTLNQIAGSSVGNIAAGSTALADAAISKATGAFTSAATQIASGVSMLSGGQDAINNVVNAATGSIPKLPGQDLLRTSIGNIATDALNKIGGSLPTGIDQLKNSLSATGLPPGAAASLESAISSLSAGGANPIKMPTVAFNTTDRSGIAGQIASTLGDSKIPTPNLLGEISQAAKSSAQKIKENIVKRIDATKQLADLNKSLKETEKAYEQARINLPAGDPGIAAARQAYLTAFNNPERQKLIDIIAGRA